MYIGFPQYPFQIEDFRHVHRLKLPPHLEAEPGETPQILHCPPDGRTHPLPELGFQQKIAVADSVDLRGVAQVFGDEDDPAAGVKGAQPVCQGDAVHALQLDVQNRQIRPKALLRRFQKLPRRGEKANLRLGSRERDGVPDGLPIPGGIVANRDGDHRPSSFASRVSRARNNSPSAPAR